MKIEHIKRRWRSDKEGLSLRQWVSKQHKDVQEGFRHGKANACKKHVRAVPVRAPAPEGKKK